MIPALHLTVISDTMCLGIALLQADQTMLLISSSMFQQELHVCMTCKHVLLSPLQCQTKLLHGRSGRVLQMDASDKGACVVCLESAVAVLSAALHVVQTSFDRLQAICFADATFLSTPGRAEQVLDERSDTCGIQRLISVARQMCDKVGCRTVSFVQVRHARPYLTVSMASASRESIWDIKAILSGRVWFAFAVYSFQLLSAVSKQAVICVYTTSQSAALTHSRS